jgi:NTE family protein
LIDLGERDAMARRDELAAFLYGVIPDTMRAA